jgi:hypothetical protein
MLRKQMVIDDLQRANPGLNLIAQKAALNDSIQTKLNDNDRRSFAAASRWIDPIMRNRSGAAIGISEAEKFVRDHFAAPGDRDQDIADKRNARIVAMKGIALSTQDPESYIKRIGEGGSAPGAVPIPGSGAGPARMSQAEAAQLTQYVLSAGPSDPRSQAATRLLRSQGFVQ